MGRKTKKHRQPEPCHSERSGTATSGGGDRRDSGASHVQSPYGPLAVCALLLLAVIVVFGQTAGHDFVNLDDNDYVYENRHVMDGLTGEGIVWAFRESHVAAHWHPLTWLSLMADAQVVKPPEGPPDRTRLAAEMHLVNLGLHAANAVILFLLLRGMTAAVWRSALAAALFAVHPLHVESVAWITERKDVLSGLFGLLALWAYAWYARRPSVLRYLLVAAALSLGLMAKPMLVTWPLLFLLLDYWPLGRVEKGGKGAGEKGRKGDTDHLPNSPSPFPPFSPSLLIVEKIPLFLLAAASSAVTFLAQQSRGAISTLEAVPISARFARAAVLYVAYLGKTLWPVNLAVVYPGRPLEGYGPALGAGLLLAVVTAGVLWGAWRGKRWLAVGWFWYLGTLVPTIGLVQVGLQVMADRFLYLPQIGLCVALVWGVGSRGEREKGRKGESPPTRDPQGGAPGAPPFSLSPFLPRSLSLLSALLLACLMVCAWRQAGYWQNSETLWIRTLACTAQNPRAHNFLGTALAGRGEAVAAIAQYRKALEIQPDYVKAHNNLGAALAARGRVDEALAQYQNALELQPDDANAHNNLGNVMAGRGEVDEAIAQYRQALEIQPDYVDAHDNLGLALARRGDLEEAIAQYRQALAIQPDDVKTHNNYGAALAGRRQFAEAITHFRKAVEVQPDFAVARNNWGLALAGCGQFAEAIAQYRQALEIQPDYLDAHLNLADALAGRGRPSEAIEHYRKALALALARNNEALARVIRARIRACQAVISKGRSP